MDVVLYLNAEITHRDEDSSFYYKKEQRYLVENHLTWLEHHKLKFEVLCEIEDELGIPNSSKFQEEA